MSGDSAGSCRPARRLNTWSQASRPVTLGYLLFLGLILWKELPRLLLSRDRSEAVFVGILAGKPAATGQRC